LSQRDRRRDSPLLSDSLEDGDFLIIELYLVTLRPPAPGQLEQPPVFSCKHRVSPCDRLASRAADALNVKNGLPSTTL
jgi:hypothetical protein